MFATDGGPQAVSKRGNFGLGPSSGSAFSGLCLQYLLLLRLCTLGGQIAAFAVAHFFLGLTPPFVPVASVIGAMALFTFFSWRQIKSSPLVSERTMFLQLVVDIFGLAALLFLTGGSANPFSPLLLLPVIVSAAMLSPGFTWLIAMEAVASYTALMFIHVHPTSQWGHAEAGFQIHLWGMWFGFLLSAGVVAYFVARMGETLRAHDRELSQVREKALQANQVVALGTLAAGTAHELGTPLATMAIVTKELEHEHGKSEALAEPLRLLREQIDRCKEILSRMAARAGQAQAHAGRPMPLNSYLTEVITEWRSLRPNAEFNSEMDGITPVPRIVADRTLTQALINVLNNAADAAQSLVTMSAHWDAAELRISVQDDGAGLPEKLKMHLGQPFVTTKPSGQGMGLGLYLARTTLEHLGGSLQLVDAPDRGVRANILLPLVNLRTN
jgi:two-component system sensor histidine kinase RegB